MGQGVKESAHPLATVIAHYRELFPAKGPTPHNLCLSHESRVKINRLHNQREAPADARLG